MERIESLTGMIDLIDDDKDSFIGGQLFQLEKVLKNQHFGIEALQAIQTH